MADDINMPATVRALSTTARVSKCDRQHREDEKRRQRKRKKRAQGQIEDLIELESNAAMKKGYHKQKRTVSANLDMAPKANHPAKVNIRI